MAKQILLNAFNMNCIGHINHGLWTHPRDTSTQYKTLDYWTSLARLLDKILVDLPQDDWHALAICRLCDELACPHSPVERGRLRRPDAWR